MSVQHKNLKGLAYISISYRHINLSDFITFELFCHITDAELIYL